MAQIPYIGQTLEELAARRRAYEMAQAQLAGQQASIFNRYGLTGHLGANGQITGLGADPNNPTGMYQQLRRGEAEDLDQLEQAQADRGFSGGLLGQETGRMKYGQHVQDTNFLRDVMDQLGDVANARQQLTFGFNDDVRNLWKNAALQAIQDRNFTPVVAPPRQGPHRVKYHGHTYRPFRPGQLKLLRAQLKRRGETMKYFRHKRPGVVPYLF